MAVKDTLKKIGLHCAAVSLGEVEVKEDITNKQREMVRAELLKSGLGMNHQSAIYHAVN